MTGKAATELDLDVLAIEHGRAVFRAAFRVIAIVRWPRTFSKPCLCA